MEYEMKPPYNGLAFREMNKEQTKEYFEWYLGQIPKRIELLANSAMTDGVPNVFDYSPDSLIPIWEWYETKISYRQRTEEEIMAEKESRPEWMRDDVSDNVISNETLMYGMGLSLYFAEVVIKNTNGKTQWGYFTKPKNHAYVNQPVILGFVKGKALNPRQIVITLTGKSAKDKCSKALYDTYFVWLKYL